VRLGGLAGYGSDAGAFCLLAHASSGDSGAHVGSVLSF